MKIRVLTGTVPTDEECNTKEGKDFLFTMMVLKGLIESATEAVKEQMKEDHFLFAPIDEFTADIVKELLEHNKALEKWLKVTELE